MSSFEEVKRRWASRCWQCGQEFAPGDERREYGIGLWCHVACWQDVLVEMEAEVEARIAERNLSEWSYSQALEEFMEHDSRERRDKAFQRTEALFGTEVALRHQQLADEAMEWAKNNHKKRTA